MRTVILRRGLVALFAAAVSFGAIVQAQAAEALRIGYQKYGTLVLLKAKGTLEKRLAEQGVKVTWTEFPGGPQLLEGLNVGSVDFGVTGETPPVFAQAAGADEVEAQGGRRGVGVRAGHGRFVGRRGRWRKNQWRKAWAGCAVGRALAPGWRPMFTRLPAVPDGRRRLRRVRRRPARGGCRRGRP